ncbi:MAG: hypothetical protein AMXMBFR23_19590 [Chloroflexota bacterium]
MLRLAFLWSLVHVVGRLPAGALDALAAAAGTATWYASRRIQEVTTDHMRHVLGPGAPRARVQAAARECARSVARYYADFARAGASPETVSGAILEVRGLEAVREAHAAGHGVIVVGAHLGNPEMVIRAAASLGLPLAAVTEPLSPPRVHEFVHRIRGREGVRFIPATTAGLRATIEHLRGGGILAMLVDRDVLGTAPQRLFFLERAPLPTGAVELARRTGAPVFIAWAPRAGAGRFRVLIEPLPLPPPTGDREGDLESGMAALTSALEAGIRRWPGQWFPLSPIWSQATPTGTRASTGSVE